MTKDGLDIFGRHLPFEHIEEALFNFGKSRSWDSKLAKWGSKGEQSLLAHALNTYSVAKKLSLRLAEDLRLSDFDVLLVVVASFIHDIGKETKDYQQSIKEGRAIDHCPVEFEEIVNLKNSVLVILEALGVNLQNQDLKQILDIVFTSTAEHMKSEYNLARALKSLSNKDERDTRVVSLVRTADAIASLKKLDEANFHLPLLEGRAEVFYHKVARIRGLLTTVLHEGLESFAEQQGAEILLTYPDGTLYLGERNNFRYAEENKIIEEVERALKNTIESGGQKIVNAILGRPGLKPLNAPELITKDNVQLVLETAARIPFRTTSKSSNEYIVKKIELMSNPKSDVASKSIKSELNERWDSLEEDLLKQYQRQYFPQLVSWNNVEELKMLLKDAEANRMMESASDAFILSIFNEIVKYLDENGAKTTEIKDKFVATFDRSLFEKLTKLGGNQPVKSRLLTIDYFWSLPASKLDASLRGNIGTIDHDKRKRYLVKLLVSLLRGAFATFQGFDSRNIAGMLVKSDLSFPFLNNYQDNDYLASYYINKNARKDSGMCAICGLSGNVEPASAALIGEGSENFTNKLPAGVNLGSPWKSRICILCKQEGILRSMLGITAAEEVILLMPQVNISREVFQVALNAFNSMILFQLKGYTPLMEYRSISELAANGKITLNDVKVFLPKNKSELALKRIQGIIQESFETLEDAISYVSELNPHIQVKEDWADIADKILGNIELIEKRDPPLFAKVHQSLASEISFVFQTPHFAAIFKRSEIRRTVRKGADISKESDSGAALRKLFVGLAFSKIMMCSVIYLRSLSVFENPIAMGACKIPEVQNAIRRVREWLDTNGDWVSIRDRDGLLKLLGSIFLVSDYTSLGIDSAFRIAYLSAGEILRRVEMKSNGLTVPLKLLEALKTINGGVQH
ncbi:MAG: HD domain-containing protein [Nitrososphaera sp.]